MVTGPADTTPVEIRCLAADTFVYIADVENNSEWQSGVREVVRTSDGPIRTGPTFFQRSQLLGQRIESEFDPNRMARSRSTSARVVDENSVYSAGTARNRAQSSNFRNSLDSREKVSSMVTCGGRDGPS